MDTSNNNTVPVKANKNTTTSRIPANFRWTPTSPQINLLEGLYNQGLRTPTPDQIQQIAAKLSTHGHIEGKNVFYWFQNHKARQRQKQKQDVINNHIHPNNHLPFVNPHHHFLRKPPLPPPHSPHGAVRHVPSPSPGYCGTSSYSTSSQADLGLPRQFRVVPAGGLTQLRPADKILWRTATAAAHRIVPDTLNNNDGATNYHDCDNYQETLPLFPLHPTGGLLARSSTSSSSSDKLYDYNHVSSSPSPSYSSCDTGVDVEDGDSGRRCFDLFSIGKGHLCPSQRY